MFTRGTAVIDDLYDRYHNRILMYCYAKLGFSHYDADDCAQEVFTIAYSKRNKLAVHPDPEGWLFKTAEFVVQKKRCKLAVIYYHELPLEYTESKRYAYDQDIDFEPYKFSDEEILALKDGVLDQLKDRDRLLYELRYEKQLTYAEICDETGSSMDAVRMRLYRINVHLHQLVKNIFSI